jgi:Fur family ferric uptake transcriptional regulator
MLQQRKEIDALLKEAGMRLTEPRRIMLDVFQKSDHALSAAQLESQLVLQMDRVTVYRILSTFFKKGLLHKVQDPDGTHKYALCSNNCDTQAHHDEHLHFHCQSCGKTYCLDQVSIPEVRLPNGFKLEEIHLSGKGICEQCH